MADLDPDKLATMGFYTSVGGTPNMFAVATSKAAFALTLIRLSQGRKRAFLWFILCSVCFIMTVSNSLLFLKCIPLEKNWNFKVQGACWDSKKVIYFNSSAGLYSALMDFVLAFIGVQTVWGLQMKMTEKIGVAVAMGMGVL